MPRKRLGTGSSFANTAPAVGLTLLLHAALFGLLIWLGSAPGAPGHAAVPPIEAELIDPDSLPSAMRQALHLSPEPPPVVQEDISWPDIDDFLAFDLDAISPETGSASEISGSGTVLPADDRRQRVLAMHRVSRVEQRIEQPAYVRANNAVGAGAQAGAMVRLIRPRTTDDPDEALLARYEAELQKAILANWIGPDAVSAGQPCRIVIEQLPGGEVVDVQVDEMCPFEYMGRRAIQAAVLKSQPLPYAGFEAVFSPSLALDFEMVFAGVRP
ncbi:MAG: TonB C-terminal domain-containing protein [Arenimonas sp.]|jgi:colicin import membrane protein